MDVPTSVHRQGTLRPRRHENDVFQVLHRTLAVVIVPLGLHGAVGVQHHAVMAAQAVMLHPFNTGRLLKAAAHNGQNMGLDV